MESLVKPQKKLASIGIKYIDVSGLGGLSWALIEGYRRLVINEKMNSRNLGYLFRNVGIDTPSAILQCKDIPQLGIIAGGGIRSGLDIAKSILLGADYATAAYPFLKAAISSPEEVMKVISQFKHELKCSMFTMGAKNITSMKNLTMR
jgi:isopentenyl-diphosphate Delta-isomerase